VAGVVLSEGSVIVFNVGDSRVYAFEDSDDDSKLSIVSVDDSPALAPGQTHTVIVTQTLGGGLRSTPIEPHVSGHKLDADTSYLVCTDGLSDVVPEDQLHAALRDHKGPAVVFELWKAAMQAGGPDNITLALVELVADDR
jgi:PPM family protein phosphatase